MELSARADRYLARCIGRASESRALNRSIKLIESIWDGKSLHGQLIHETGLSEACNRGLAVCDGCKGGALKSEAHAEIALERLSCDELRYPSH